MPPWNSPSAVAFTMSNTAASALLIMLVTTVPGRPGRAAEDVAARCDLRIGERLALRGIPKRIRRGAGVRRVDDARGTYGLHALLVADLELANQRPGHSAHEPDVMALGHQPGDCADEKRALL